MNSNTRNSDKTPAEDFRKTSSQDYSETSAQEYAVSVDKEKSINRCEICGIVDHTKPRCLDRSPEDSAFSIASKGLSHRCGNCGRPDHHQTPCRYSSAPEVDASNDYAANVIADVDKGKRIRRCGICRGTDHNKRTCQNRQASKIHTTNDPIESPSIDLPEREITDDGQASSDRGIGWETSLEEEDASQDTTFRNGQTSLTVTTNDSTPNAVPQTSDAITRRDKKRKRELETYQTNEGVLEGRRVRTRLSSSSNNDNSYIDPALPTLDASRQSNTAPTRAPSESMSGVSTYRSFEKAETADAGKQVHLERCSSTSS